MPPKTSIWANLKSGISVRVPQNLQFCFWGGNTYANTVIYAIHNKNVFEQLMEAAKYCSIGRLTGALFDVGGQYRRSM